MQTRFIGFTPLQKTAEKAYVITDHIPSKNGAIEAAAWKRDVQNQNYIDFSVFYKTCSWIQFCVSKNPVVNSIFQLSNISSWQTSIIGVIPCNFGQVPQRAVLNEICSGSIFIWDVASRVYRNNMHVGIVQRINSHANNFRCGYRLSFWLFLPARELLGTSRDFSGLLGTSRDFSGLYTKRYARTRLKSTKYVRIRLQSIIPANFPDSQVPSIFGAVRH